MRTHNKPAPEGISLPEYMGLFTDADGSQIFGVYEPCAGLPPASAEPIRFVSYLQYPEFIQQTHPVDLPQLKFWMYAMEFAELPDRTAFQQKLSEYGPKFREYLKQEAERARGANGAPK